MGEPRVAQCRTGTVKLGLKKEKKNYGPILCNGKTTLSASLLCIVQNLLDLCVRHQQYNSTECYDLILIHVLDPCQDLLGGFY